MVNDLFFHFLLRQNLSSKFRSRVLLLQMYAQFTVLQSQRPTVVRIEAKRSYHFLVYTYLPHMYLDKQTDRQTDLLHSTTSSSSSFIPSVAS